MIEFFFCLELNLCAVFKPGCVTNEHPHPSRKSAISELQICFSCSENVRSVCWAAQYISNHCILVYSGAPKTQAEGLEILKKVKLFTTLYLGHGVPICQVGGSNVAHYSFRKLGIYVHAMTILRELQWCEKQCTLEWYQATVFSQFSPCYSSTRGVVFWCSLSWNAFRAL